MIHHIGVGSQCHLTDRQIDTYVYNTFSLLKIFIKRRENKTLFLSIGHQEHSELWWYINSQLQRYRGNWGTTHFLINTNCVNCPVKLPLKLTCFGGFYTVWRKQVNYSKERSYFPSLTTLQGWQVIVLFTMGLLSRRLSNNEVSVLNQSLRML